MSVPTPWLIPVPMRNLRNDQEISVATNSNVNGMVSGGTTSLQISCEPNIPFTNNHCTSVLHPGFGITTGPQTLNEQRTESAIQSSKIKQKQIIYPSFARTAQFVNEVSHDSVPMRWLIPVPLRNLQINQEISLGFISNLHRMVSDITTRFPISCKPNLEPANNQCHFSIQPSILQLTTERQEQKSEERSTIHTSKSKQKQITNLSIQPTSLKLTEQQKQNEHKSEETPAIHSSKTNRKQNTNLSVQPISLQLTTEGQKQNEHKSGETPAIISSKTKRKQITNLSVQPISLQLSTEGQKQNEQKSEEISAIHSSKTKQKQITNPDLTEQECGFEINGTTLYSCPVCKQTFSFFPELQDHMRSHSIKCKTFKCEVCDKRFEKNSYLIGHKKCHVEARPFSCDICDKTFKRAMQVTAHKKTHSGEKRYVCDQCDYATEKKCVLVYHKNCRHKRVLDFVCKICGKNCSSPYELKDHQYTHGEKRFKCTHCDKAFFRKINLKNHEEIHDPNRIKCQCEICGNEFTSVGGLKKHKLSAHLNQKKETYQCEFCETTVTSLGSLKVHRRRHTGDKPFSCDVCNKSFNAKNYLITHKRVHTGEKPFTCKLCNTSFSQRGTLTIHMRLHTGDKRYECESCSKAFVTKTLLKTHMKCHA